MKHTLIIALIVSIIFNGFMLVNVMGREKLTGAKAAQSTKPNTEELREAFPLLSPRTFIDNPNDRLINFVKLREELRTYHSSIPDLVGFYFEYLPTGVSIGINEKEEFVLASLLRVPLIMGVYKAINNGEIRHDQVLTIQQQTIDTQFGDLWKRGVGAQITVDEAIRLTLTQSDNTAKELLIEIVGSQAIEEVYNNLDIPIDFKTDRPIMTPKNYTSVLRSLYLSSYVPYDDSQAILTLLTQSPFSDKIVAGVPDTVTVAHKIGVYVNPDKETSVYTDCGIFYVPKRPYILCAMTQSAEPNARTYMRTISKIIYDYIISY
jgi:beta-lactamase class A